MPVSSTADEQSADNVEGAALPVNELFYSLQGEGKAHRDTVGVHPHKWL